jgi:SagB-type dehydrogenase family enzyme
MKNKQDYEPKYKHLKTRFDKLDSITTDQNKGVPLPPMEKPYKETDTIIELPKPNREIVKVNDIFTCLNDRRSRRKYTETPNTLDELSYLLWFTQGIKRIFKRDEYYSVAIRTVPSAGARNPLETYLVVNNVEELEQGVYRYLPITHQLLRVEEHNCTEENLMAAINNQEFVVKAPVIFMWAALPYRTEWRYATEAEKLVLLDAGHVCQNLYIAAESLRLGVCAIAAYVQEEADRVFNLDGEDEFILYLASVGNHKK